MGSRPCPPADSHPPTSCATGSWSRAEGRLSGLRGRLVGWLDGIGVQDALGLPSTRGLFAERADLVHATSVVRYPVTLPDGSNLSGHAPALAGPALGDLVRRLLVPELASVPNAVIVPLGAAVGRVLGTLVDAGDVDPDRCLRGFPHPSGANGHGRVDTPPHGSV